MEDQIYVITELLAISVNIRIQFIFDGTEIHWLFDDIKIIAYAKLHWIDWLLK